MSDPQPGPPPSRRFIAILSLLVGLVLLLPGLCSLFFVDTARDALGGGGNGPSFLELWIAGVLIGGGGVALITWAVWRGGRP